MQGAPRRASPPNSLASPDEYTAPARGVDVGDGLREGPAVAGEILRRVLPLAVHVVGRRRDDRRPRLLGAAAMRIHVGDSHEDHVSRRAERGPVGGNEVPAAERELGAVLPDAKPLDTPEGRVLIQGPTTVACDGRITIRRGVRQGKGHVT